MANERPLTLSEARTLLSAHAHTDDFELALNEALERIYSEGIWDGVVDRIDLNPTGGNYISNEILTLPYDYEALIAIAIDENPTPIMARQYEFMESGPGIEEAGKGGGVVVDLGFDDAGGTALRKYKILNDITADTEVEGLLKKRFKYLTLDSELVFPANIGALKHALLAIVYENEGDIERSTAFWAECYDILQSAKQVSKAGINNPNPQQPWGFMTNKPYNII
tara:strand:+ start:3193 stop:3864 length:672 start_codon:yes stop_codon:yes gene_type:complete